MKKFRFLGFLAIFIPLCSFGAGGDFQSAAQLLTAARRGDIQTVQYLINMGADVNYVDASGMSLVCTAVMNNDRRAIQILQMYGADASQCDRQIKKQKQKTKLAQNGESFNFFSGLSSSHVLLLSAVGVAAVLGGVALLTDVFDADNDNSSSPSGGSHGSGGGSSGSSSTANKLFTVPYGPAYLNSEGAVDTSFDIKTNLPLWDTTTAGIVTSDFNYFRPTVATTDNFLEDGLPSTTQNYLLTMRGYYSLASGYLGQFIFRNSNSNAPITPAIIGSQMRPVRVALITGNGINPTGSADPADGITYAVSNNLQSATPIVDKYLNNTLTKDGNVYTETEISGFDLSGSGSAFNPYATKTESALAKIVAGWNGGRSSDNGDLMGFVPNGQLAIYRTGYGTTWSEITTATDRPEIGTFTDKDDNNVLSAGDSVILNTITYNIVNAVDKASVSGQKTMTIAGVTYEISSNSKILIGECGTDCDDIAIYVGTDGAWYVKSSNTSEIDNVYFAIDDTVYGYKTKNTESAYTNFSAMDDAVSRTYSVVGDPDTTSTSDVIANLSVLPNSTNMTYLTVDNFTTMADIYGVDVSDSSKLMDFYNAQITSYYGGAEGGKAHNLFYNKASLPLIIMPAGDYLYKDSSGNFAQVIPSATFENYAPMIYGNNLKHDFMTVVAVSHENGTSAASTITEYGDGTSNSYGPIVLSKWADSDGNIYSSRICGITGVGNSGSNIDPWCFAAAGPTAEMATASAAGAVASVKSAFSYMSNDQVFTLLALTADGPYLGSSDGTTRFSADTLKTYLQNMYELPLSYNESSLSSSEYLEVFKKVFGYGLINLERA
ncbi:MAG: ankyrin repeat domain-containing protein, partial [Alphaproteobacteria bacterium]|nr:ankyrin repeat domain-containing protein [Alphaproteobacteria bacterium]